MVNVMTNEIIKIDYQKQLQYLQYYMYQTRASIEAHAFLIYALFTVLGPRNFLHI